MFMSMGQGVVHHRVLRKSIVIVAIFVIQVFTSPSEVRELRYSQQESAGKEMGSNGRNQGRKEG